jgi:hypothetical protein
MTPMTDAIQIANDLKNDFATTLVRATVDALRDEHLSKPESVRLGRYGIRLAATVVGRLDPLTPEQRTAVLTVLEQGSVVLPDVPPVSA